MEMNRFTLKALLLSVITECKFGQALAPNAKQIKAAFKKAVGLNKSATNGKVLSELKRVFTENNLAEDFDRVLIKFDAVKYLEPVS